MIIALNNGSTPKISNKHSTEVARGVEAHSGLHLRSWRRWGLEHPLSLLEENPDIFQEKKT